LQLLRPAAAQPAPAPGVPPSIAHVRGTIASLGGGGLTVVTPTGTQIRVAFDTKTPVTAISPASLADIKPGSYVGTAAMPGPNGTLTALEVHIFPERLRGAGDGHRPFYLQPESTMTNGTVGGDVASVGGGRTIVVKYNGGEKTVTVPDNAPIVMLDTGSQDMLTPGAHVSVTATESTDGSLTATRIAVGRNGITPPI
jgi:hypothetical protein